MSRTARAGCALRPPVWVPLESCTWRGAGQPESLPPGGGRRVSCRGGRPAQPVRLTVGVYGGPAAQVGDLADLGWPISYLWCVRTDRRTAVVMLGGALIVGADVEDADGKEDLNIKAVLLDTAADAGAAAGVAVTGAIIFVTGRWNWLDPAVALVIAVVIGYHAGGLIWRVLAALGIRTHPNRNTNT
jgi:Cation efflux family